MCRYTVRPAHNVCRPVCYEMFFQKPTMGMFSWNAFKPDKDLVMAVEWLKTASKVVTKKIIIIKRFFLVHRAGTMLWLSLVLFKYFCNKNVVGGPCQKNKQTNF